MVALIDAQVVVGLGDQPVTAYPALASLLQSVQNLGTPLFSSGSAEPPPRWCRDRSTMVSVTSVRRRGSPNHRRGELLAPLSRQKRGASLSWGLLKKPDRLRRNWFQRSRPAKLATYRAIDDCCNC
jgi:hypothetical protein